MNNPAADVCLPEEACLGDLGMSIGVCADTMCASPADCPLAPPGGDAEVVCTDLTGNSIGECVLSCALGQACPTGMICFGGVFCAWEAMP